MKAKEKACFLFGWLLLATPVAVQAQFNYTITNGTVTITQYTGPGGSLTIPDTVTGLPVTAIGDSAFAGHAELTSVSIPDSVISLGAGAFVRCAGLTSVTIGNGVTNIAILEFYQCTSLTSVTIPDSVRHIGADAFGYCSNLTSITIPDSVLDIQQDFDLWDRDNGGAFEYCSALTNVTIGGSVTNIGAYAFEGCASLTKVSIPSSVTSIGGGAFGYCTSLTNIMVDPLNPAYSSVSGVLFDKSQTTLIQYPGGEVGSYSIPNSVTSIGAEAFANCINLTSVSIPNNVTSIGGFAFSDCSSLTNIMVDPLNPAYSSVSGVLFNKSQTTLIQYPIGKRGSYVVPNNVTSIGAEVFANCISLSSITIPDSVTSIGIYAFYYCTGLTNVKIGNSVTSIGAEVFANCTSLTSVTIPNSVTGIGDDAFLDCTNLTSVTIGNSVTSIWDESFSSCTSLASVYFQGNAPSVYSVFSYDKNATAYYLPGTTGWGSTFGGIPTALWSLPYPLILNSSIGVRSNQFGFTVSWATNVSVVVEATTDLGNPDWSPLATNALSWGTNYFGDAQWTEYSTRFYRVRSQ
jgi:hypothetical protein